MPEDRLDLRRQPVENQAQIDAISVRVARGEITKEQALQEIEALKALPREGIAGPPPSLPDYHSVVSREMYLSTGIDQLWYTRGHDALDAISESALNQVRQRPVKIAELSEELQAGVRRYLEVAKSEMSDARYAATRFAEFGRDSALLNYNRRFNYNSWLGMMAPYEFWFTQSMFKWALHSIDRPAMLSTSLRVQKFLETAYRPAEGLPSRLRGNIRVALPFLPDWMGSEICVDPLRALLPFKSFAYPLEQFQEQQAGDLSATQRTLEELHNDGKITEQDYQQALTTQAGPTWERAMTLARQDDTEGRLSPFDLMSMLTQPHAPIMWAYNVARGTPENIQPFLPITRSIRGATALLGIGPPGGVNPEASIRLALGLPAFDKWDDYRIDRMISNMAADGSISADDALRATIDRTGEAFREAQRRAGIEFGVGAMGSLTGIPLKAYPEGEELQRRLRVDYEGAWSRYEQGDANAMRDFYNKHPEYEARLALFRSPQERLQRFLVDNLWNQWNELPKLQKDEVRDQLGDLFQLSFLDKETRSYDNIPLEQLAMWVKVMGGNPPGSLNTQGAVPLQLPPDEVSWRAQVFYDTRTRYFPDWYTQQNDYYRLNEGKARKNFLVAHPDYARYRAWRNDWLLRNPDVSPYLTDTPPTYKSEAELRKAEAAQPSFLPEEFASYLGLPLSRLMEDGGPLSPSALEALKRLGVTEEQLSTLQ